MAAQITINQAGGAGAGTPGEARDDIWLSTAVQLVSSGTGTSWLWEMLDKPATSASTLSTPTASSSAFTPDRVGTYRIKLTVDGGGAGNVVILVIRVRYTSAGVLTRRGWALPAVEEYDDENNYNGNTRGWAEVWEKVIPEISGALTTLVYRQAGGINAGHVFDDWATLYETFLRIDGFVEIRIDGPGTNTIPAGTWDMEQRANFVGQPGTLVGPPTLMRLAHGAILQDVNSFTSLAIDVTGTDVGSIVGTGPTLFKAEDTQFTNNSTAGPLISVDVNSVIMLRGLSTVTAATAQPAILFAPGATCAFLLEDSANVGTDACAGAATSTTVNLTGVSSSFSATQTGLAGTLTINGPSVSEPYTFIFRPGYTGPAQPNIYTSWSTLMTALGDVEGPKIVKFDDQDGACQIPSGIWDMGVEETTLRGSHESNPGAGTVLTILNGAVLKNIYALDQGLIVKSTSTAPVLEWDGTSDPQTLHLDHEAEIDSQGATVPLVNLATANHLIVEMRGTSKIQRSGGAVSVIDITDGGASLVIRQFDQSYISDNVITISAGTASVNLLSNTAQYQHSAVAGLTVSRVASRRRIFNLTKGNNTEATGTAMVAGAVYIDPEELPNYSDLSNFNPTAKFRVVMETTAPGQAAVMDLFDTNGVFNAGTPTTITGSQQDTATGTGPSRPGGGTPLTPNPLVASAYEVDVTTAFFGGSWTAPGVYEARLWIATAGGGNVATCKSAELIIEW